MKNGMKELYVAVATLCLTAGISYAALTGAHIVERENRYKSVAKDFVEVTYEQEDNSLFLGENNDGCILPEYSSETTISRGRYLKKEIEKKGVLYCEFLDEYYTPTGSPIAIIDTCLSDEGKALYRRIEVLDNLEEPLEIQDNEDVRIIKTKSYDELIDMDLVVEMDTEKKVISQGEEMFEGKMTLK